MDRKVSDTKIALYRSKSGECSPRNRVRQDMHSKMISPLKTASAAGLFFVLAACSDTTLGTKSFDETLPTTTIPGFPLQIALSGSIPVPLTAEAQSVADDTEFVTFATLRSLSLNILDSSESDANDDGAMDTFDFLTSMQVFVNAEINGALSEILVASLPEDDPQVGSGSRELVLTVEDVDVLDYLEAPGGYGLRVQGSGTVPPDDVVFNGDLRYRVGIGIRS